ncbi:hypothetical protein G5I_12284 [Acromyrmex echinatior]|uniref:Uncharacterized protein n=1 Tax=Acromyrmex echinatior TaxID=103372 RepID=F4X1W5_ACREC|nr:hypothetical protein G5I_12284 [Acromyrmex echinatior]
MNFRCIAIAAKVNERRDATVWVYFARLGLTHSGFMSVPSGCHSGHRMQIISVITQYSTKFLLRKVNNSGSYGVSSQGLSRRVVLFSVEWYAGVPEIATILLVYMANIMEYTMSCKATSVDKRDTTVMKIKRIAASVILLSRLSRVADPPSLLIGRDPPIVDEYEEDRSHKISRSQSFERTRRSSNSVDRTRVRFFPRRRREVIVNQGFNPQAYARKCPTRRLRVTASRRIRNNINNNQVISN